MSHGLADQGVRFVPAVTNFLFIELEAEGEPLARRLLEMGVIVRPMAWMGFPHALRVTVGTREENTRFLEAMKQLRGAAAGTQK